MDCRNIPRLTTKATLFYSARSLIYMSLFDSHCHLDRFFHEGLLDQVLLRAEVAGVNRMVAIGTEPNDWSIYSELAKTYSKT